MSSVAIVGAGPAGIRAAEILVEGDLRPVLVDEGRQPGGQGYRKLSPGLTLDLRALMGSEMGRYERLHARFDAIRDRIDYRPETLAWAVQDRALFLVQDGSPETLRFDALILATGAVDRIMPLPGWTLPGVFTLGGSQVILKDQGCVIGRRVVFLGSSPLLLLAALQYHEVGATVAAVADTTAGAAKLATWRDLLASPPTLARGLLYRTKLHRAGVVVLDGVTPVAIAGTDRVEAVHLKDSSGGNDPSPATPSRSATA
jgi:NADPH-dependent 2,4-dienoyl-CoA reductase/sulfur reductase-like enzyme